MSYNIEQVLTNSYKEDMILYLKSHPEDFIHTVELALSNNQMYSWRASWLLWSCIENNDARLYPYLDDIINIITLRKDGHQRELLILLLKVELSENQNIRLFDTCVLLFSSINKKPSVRITALKVLVKIAKMYPELQNELRFLSEPQFLETLPPASKKSALRIMNSLLFN